MELFQKHQPGLTTTQTGREPVKISDVEISEPLQAISSFDHHLHRIYQRALVLVRLHSFPLGLVEIDLHDNRVSSTDIGACIWDQLNSQINQHLLEDGLPRVVSIPQEGIQSVATPRCLLERQTIRRTAPPVSIILATRDRVQSLSVTLDALLSLKYPNFEIILVDNAPRTNATLDFWNLHRDRFSKKNICMRYVRERVPGLAVAHNRGLEEVSGSIVAFTDDDVCVDRYWLTELVRGFQAAQSVGCVTGLVIPFELETPAQVLFEEFGGFTKGFTQKIYGLGEFDTSNPLFPYTAGRFGTGANMAFRTEFLQKLGGFDPALGIGTPTLGADDMAAFFQAIICGNQLVYQPSALVFHQHRRTYDGLRKQVFGYGVGLTAFLTKCILDNPNLIFDFASKIPAGVKYAFDPTSTKNQHKSNCYPHDLDSVERKGMLYGPIAYLYSRWRYRNARSTLFTKKWSKEPFLSRDDPRGPLDGQGFNGQGDL